MHIKDAEQIIYAADSCNHVPLLVGPHGIGKSELVKQYAKENNLHCEVLILSLMDESDLLGIPYKVDRDDIVYTSWAAPVWLSRIIEAHKNGQRSVLLLDELNRAPASVLGASLQLILDKRLNDHVLPPGTLLVAAINPEDGDYNVNSLDPAVLDRLVICDLEADALAWIEWAKGKINPIVVDFIIKNPGKIHLTPKNGGKGASPRSWTRLATYIDFIQSNEQTINTFYLKGSVGDVLAAEFLMFFNNYTKNVSFEDIIKLYNQKSHLKFNTIIKHINDEVEKLEAIQRMDLAKALEKAASPLFELITISYKNNATVLEYPKEYNRNLLMAYITYLYTLPIEAIAAYLKNLKGTDNSLYMKLAGFDGEINNKELFKKLIT